jgi:hypothetical protein
MSLQLPSRAPEAGFYYHYKHDPAKGIRDYAYEVIAVGFHTEEDCRPEDRSFVNYRPLYENSSVYQASKQLGIQCMDNRPLEMWMGDVEKSGRTFPRFAKITEPNIISELEKIRGEMYN